MYCLECGKELPDTAKFCPDCGASQVVKVKPVKTKSKTKALPKKTDYAKMSLAEVKEIVKSKNLPVSGPKWRLIERLTDKNWKENEEKERKERKKWMEENPIHDAGNVWLFTKGGLIFSCFTAYFLTFFCIVFFGYVLGEWNITELRTNIQIWYNAMGMAFVFCTAILIVFVLFFLILRFEAFAKILFVLVLIFGFMFFLEIVNIEGIGFGLKALGICLALSTIGIVLHAMNENESMIEAAGHAWLMLTALGAIITIIIYVILF